MPCSTNLHTSRNKHAAPETTWQTNMASSDRAMQLAVIPRINLSRQATAGITTLWWTNQTAGTGYPLNVLLEAPGNQRGDA
jgi:hypothetical protein